MKKQKKPRPLFTAEQVEKGATLYTDKLNQAVIDKHGEPMTANVYDEVKNYISGVLSELRPYLALTDEFFRSREKIALDAVFAKENMNLHEIKIFAEAIFTFNNYLPGLFVDAGYAAYVDAKKM